MCAPSAPVGETVQYGLHGDDRSSAACLALGGIAWNTMVYLDSFPPPRPGAVFAHRTAGASGLTAVDGWIDTQAEPVDTIVDTNGADDAFFAGFATAWSNEEGLAAAMSSGAESAAAAVRSPDPAPRPR